MHFSSTSSLRAISVLVSCFCAPLALGCGGGTSPADAGSANDAPLAMDAPPTDAPALDAPGSDTPGTDTPTTDDAPAADAPIESDGGIDCSTIGCGAPVICGEACTAPCGCCPCGDGTMMTAGGVSYVCTGGCWVASSVGGACTIDADCGPGLSCCYPCGIPGCSNVCEPTCSDGDPGCAGGCLLRP